MQLGKEEKERGRRLRQENQGPEAPKSRPGASKIEAGALQDVIFEDI